MTNIHNSSTQLSKLNTATCVTDGNKVPTCSSPEISYALEVFSNETLHYVRSCHSDVFLKICAGKSWAKSLENFVY